MNPDNYINKISAPKNYNKFALVKIKAGTKMRMGIANSGEINGIMRQGGGVQFEVLEKNLEKVMEVIKTGVLK